ncbi:hypothetical protein ACFY9N_11735 [Microbacterium sp. NPDC008134]|uniref:hypothetical protein n=1 Tax=Microbacterium sp. NPDC008134 TaxID=3364183 RepID=UPI0036F03963
MPDQIDLDALEALANAATTGPWHWAGNTDTGEPYLATWIDGAGRCQVLAIGHDDRSETGRAADDMRASLADCGYDVADIEHIVHDWAVDSFGMPRRDARLEFGTDLMMVNARDLAIYEVAPNALSREDPDVYRADVSGIRHPDATYIAAAHPAVVLALIAELRATRTAAAAAFDRAADILHAKDHRTDLSGDPHSEGWGQALNEAESDLRAAAGSLRNPEGE